MREKREGRAYCAIFLLSQSFSAWLLLIGRYGNVTFFFSVNVFVWYTSGFEGTKCCIMRLNFISKARLIFNRLDR